YAALAVALVALADGPVSAQIPDAAQKTEESRQTELTARKSAAAQPKYAFSELRAIGVGLVIIGAAIGIGGLTKSAVESMARQPEMAGDIRTAMIISAALIEGVTFFALIIIGFILTAY
ncbi:MAG TPA: ATP synthase F0 subunit C, partial [Isosphaeraceae bacterium]|nr:ATP synthase F0 subunit C [Isosphaeraceae bacterium]